MRREVTGGLSAAARTSGAPQRALWRTATVLTLVVFLPLALAQPAFAHEDQVLSYGSFLAGLTHPVLGLDHFLAMVSVGIVSALLGGRAILTVPGMFVLFMGIGGLAGWLGLGIPSLAVELAIATSVVLLGGVIAADARVPIPFAMGAVAFFGFFHGFAHGSEIPDVAEPVVYAAGFMLGTILLHLLGVLIGDIAKRYTYGPTVLRIAGIVFVAIGILFIVEAV